MPGHSLNITLPDWVPRIVDYTRRYGPDEERMALAVELARENVRHSSGGPFGAAIFDADGTLLGVGVNRVVPLANSVLHAEIVAFMMAEARLGTYTLAGDGTAVRELFTSCEPCAMCLGAAHWSGVRRVVWAATRGDAGQLAFDEGPVFDATYDYLKRRGMTFEAGPLREQARQVLALYDRSGGEIYNG